MKRILAVLMLIMVLCGCGGEADEMGRAMALRKRLQQCTGCTFDAVVTADYGSATYTFSMNCSLDSEKNLSFIVTDPDTISGIKGIISKEGGKLTFEDAILAFEMLAEGQLTPVSAPWILVNSLCSGYISLCGTENDGMRIGIDDTYRDESFRIESWTDETDLPLRGEIIWQGRRILTVDVRNVVFV